VPFTTYKLLYGHDLCSGQAKGLARGGLVIIPTKTRGTTNTTTAA